MVFWCVFAVFVFLSVASGREEEVLKNIERLRERGIVGEEVIRMIEGYRDEVRELSERARERSEEWKLKEDRKSPTVAEGRDRFEGRLYIFMSSSVPVEIWNRYMDHVVEKELDAIFLLRGCVGGCRYIGPTLRFLREVIGERPVEVWIDPAKFREYGVKAVPCVALEGRRELSCGDWNLGYHLKVLGNGEG